MGRADWTREFGSEDEVDADGTIRKIGVTPPPYTQPHPKIFVPFTLSPQTLIDAAKKGYTPIMYEGRAQEFNNYCKQYRDLAAEAGRDLQLGESVAAVRSICLGRPSMRPSISPPRRQPSSTTTTSTSSAWARSIGHPRIRLTRS